MKFYEIEEKGIILSNPANTSEHQRATSERTANTSEHQRKESNHSEHQRRPAKKSEQQRRPNYPNLHDESQIAIKMAKFSQTDQNVDMWMQFLSLPIGLAKLAPVFSKKGLSKIWNAIFGI